MSGYCSDLLGALGILTMSIPCDDRPGEIRVRLPDGFTDCLLAYSPLPIPAGWEVLIVNARGPRSVDVEPWGLGPDPTFDVSARTSDLERSTEPADLPAQP